MEERFTIQLDVSAQPERLAKLAERLAEAFLLSREEAQALLSADTLVLKRSEALALVKMCRQEGVGVSLNAPLLTPAVRTQRWLKRFTLPIVFSLSSALVVLALILWALPNRSPERVEVTTSGGGVAVALPWVESADADTEVIAVEPYGALPESGTVQGEAVENGDVATDEVEEAESPSELDLFSAARDLSASELSAVLDRSPEVDLRDAYAQTPLMYAAGNSTAESVAALLGAGADVNALTDAGWTPLMYAVRNLEDLGVAQVLLNAGADPLVKNASGQTAKDIALAYNNDNAATTLEAFLEEQAEALQQAQQRVEPPAPIVEELSTAPIAETQTASIIVEPTSSAPVAVGGSISIIEIAPDPADPALALFDRQSGAASNNETRNVILECLEDWASCAEN